MFVLKKFTIFNTKNKLIVYVIQETFLDVIV